MRFVRRIVACLLVVAAAPISVAVAGAGAAPLVIAHVAPTTGRFSLHAEADRRGVEMAVEEFNARGGVLGREVVLVSRDPTLDPANAAKEELIGQTRIGFMVGAVSSGVAASMSAVCQKYGVVFINTNSSAPSEAVENAHRTKFVFDTANVFPENKAECLAAGMDDLIPKAGNAEAPFDAILLWAERRSAVSAEGP